MKSLVNLQQHFQEHLLSKHSFIENEVISTANATAIKRLGIYKDAYEARLIECLASNFPNLKMFMGDEQFYQLGLAYLKHFPSTNRSIRWFGDNLSSFLSTYSNHEFLVELAEFEWKMTLAFDATDERVLALEEMALISPEMWPDMKLVVHSSFQRLHFKWNTVQLWQALEKHTHIESCQNELISSWALWRDNYINRFCTVDEEESWFLDSMAAGKTFADLCQGLCQWNAEDDIGLKAATFLKKWIQMGIISKIVTVRDMVNLDEIGM